ncbi:MAG: Fur family transcriptional regulator [bacterium]
MKAISNMGKLKNILKEKDLKPTYQRLKVLEYLDKHMNGHPTVEMIYEALAKNIPTMSMTTVYNTLNAFLEKRLVSAVTITGTEIRYDFNTSPHHHFLCKKCGRIIDIDIKCPVVDKKKIYGHRIEEFHRYIKGVCKDCLKNEKNKSKHNNDS